MIVGLSGQAGTGKDTVADVIVRHHGFVKVALADPIKRICKEVYDFSDEQLYGPSEKRNEPDKRYPRPFTEEEQKKAESLRGTDADTLHREYPLTRYLTPRYALQLLGTEWARDCYVDTWVDYALRVAKELLDGGFVYTPQKGLESEYGHENCPQYPYSGVVIPDVRFKNEMAAIKKAGGKVVRIKRSVQGLPGSAGRHASEQEQLDIPDSMYDFVFQNDGPENVIYERIGPIMRKLLGIK